jgi:hypothetical protein
MFIDHRRRGNGSAFMCGRRRPSIASARHARCAQSDDWRAGNICKTTLTEKEKAMSDVVVPIEKIQKAIYLVRGQKVMLDRDLAEL